MKEFEFVQQHDDRVKWCPKQDGIFISKSCYNVLREKVVAVDPLQVEHVHSLCSLWKVTTPSKIKVFGWRLLTDRLPTRDHLVRRNIIQGEYNRVCVLCFEMEENLSHILFHCNKIREVWETIYNWLGIMNMVGIPSSQQFNNFVFQLKGRMKKKIRGGC